MPEPKCELCGEKLTIDELKVGICKCGYPISEANRALLLANAKIKEKVPDIKPPAKLTPEMPPVVECRSCGFTISSTDLDAGTPCPSCGQDPRKEASPPEMSKSKAPTPVVPPVNKGATPVRPVPVQPIQGSVTLVIIIGPEKGKTIIVMQGEPVGRGTFEKTLSGSNPKAFEFLSTKHMRFTWEGGHLLLEDLGSKNGTMVNDVPLEVGKPKVVNIGDRLVIGKGATVFRITGCSQIQAPRVAMYNLKETLTGVIYPITIKPGEREIVGRLPVDDGPMHPFLSDVLFHRLSTGEDEKVVRNEIQYISRKHFMLEWKTGSFDSFKITNLSKSGMKVGDTQLSKEGDVAEAGELTKLSFGKGFECMIEKTT